MSIKSPVKTWNYESLKSYLGNKTVKTIAHNTLAEVKDTSIPSIYILLHGNPIAVIFPSGHVRLLPAAYEWITYTTQVRLNKILWDNENRGIYRHHNSWVNQDGKPFED